MTRTLCILTGILLALSPFLSDRFARDDHPDQTHLNLARGGNPNTDTTTYRCDDSASGLGGGYLGCTATGGNCTQCATSNPDGSFSPSTFKKVTTAGHPVTAGYMYDSLAQTQDCGAVFNGTCVVDTTSPTGFTCTGTLSNYTCGEVNGIIYQRAY